MHCKSVLNLSTAGYRLKDAGDLSITHVTEDQNVPQFRRHAWLIITYLVDFYRVFVPLKSIVADLESLAGALADLAEELSDAHVAKAA